MAQRHCMATDQNRGALDRVLDALIPGSADGRIPGAGSCGTGAAVTAALQADGSLARAVAFVTEGRVSEPAARAEALEREDPTAFTALLRAVYLAYYSRPEIRALMGLVPLPARSRAVTASPAPAHGPDDLAAPVLPRRGPFSSRHGLHR
ncbi:hypothetical protein ACW9UR_15540 [Halovulum sp. GXIMD14794]